MGPRMTSDPREHLSQHLIADYAFGAEAVAAAFTGSLGRCTTWERSGVGLQPVLNQAAAAEATDGPGSGASS